MNICERLFELADENYKAFNSKLIPTVDSETVIGVRTPAIRMLAKEICGGDAEEFMAELPHKYYEEYNLHGFLIEKIKDYDTCIASLNAFLPYVNNWATCDCITPKVFGKNTDKLLSQIDEWLCSKHTYTVRFAIKMLMNFYLDEKFDVSCLEKVACVKSDEYYINMMIAWYFATALAKQYDAAVLYIENRKLDTWTHNKAIQKATESNRVSEEKKAYLKTLKIK